MNTSLRMTTIALLALAGLSFGSLAPTAAATAGCVWNDREGSVVWTVEYNTNGGVDFRNGSPCTVVVHPGKIVERVDEILPGAPGGNPLGCVEGVEWRLFEPGPCPIVLA